MDADERRKAKSEAVKRWRKAHPETAKANNKRYAGNWVSNNRGKALLNECRKRARANGRDCELTSADLELLLADMVCVVTGMPLSFDWSGPGLNPWGPSIDRIDSSLGYTLANSRVVCTAYNFAKNAWGDDVVLTWVHMLARK